jgi:hypothetical protein
MQQPRSFYIAPFDVSGELVGTGLWSTDSLSSQWLSFITNLVESESFAGPLPLEPLAHISLRLTSAEGAALTTFHCHGHLASSAVALTGGNRAADLQILAMFVESLKPYALAQNAVSPAPFSKAFELSERPLYIVVAWGNPAIPKQDQSLVVELNTHLAGALLATGPLPNKSFKPNPLRGSA